MKREIELLAPGGDIDAIKAAILAGADAIYCGLNKFNARNRAANINFDELQGVLRLAHQNDCQIFLTLNILIVDSEIPDLIRLLNRLVNTSIDGIIIQDLGLFYLLSTYFKSLDIHASTQCTTHNQGQIKFLSRMNASRVNLCRELNLEEIKALTSFGHRNSVQTEVFVHGSNCISFSGICYISSVKSGNSGNRGRCSQPCRDRYQRTLEGKDYPLNLKDNSAFFDLRELAEAGVASLKIEGRIKKADYVYTVVNTWDQHIQNYFRYNTLKSDSRNLYKVFNRGFSNSFLKGEIGKDMFIDNPRDNSIQHLSEINHYASHSKLVEDQKALYDEKEEMKAKVELKISRMNASKGLLHISLSGQAGDPLRVEVQTPDDTFEVLSDCNLAITGTQALNLEVVMKRFKAFNETEYCIKHLNLEKIEGELYIPFKELTTLKNRILFILNGARETVAPVELPRLKNQKREPIQPTLSVLISSPEDLALCDDASADIFYQLPNGFRNQLDELVRFFAKNQKLIPWFPSVLIGEDYQAAVEFLQKVNPGLIVTNNTGIAWEAFERGISWIAGPYLNIVNSYSLLCLKEKWNCSGAFISNELSKQQIKGIRKPENFKLYYSIYHPIVLMTSRQCLFHQVSACGKNAMDDSCISSCEKSSSIVSLKEDTLIINKEKGNYHSIYNETNFLNLDILTDVPDFFTGFTIDLRDVKTKTQLRRDKPGIVHLFQNHLKGKPNSVMELKQMIQPTTNTQYLKGI
ncbi:MAG: peptidase U32 family protein [Marinifilaceae bacterium]